MGPKTTRESATELARRGVPVFPLVFRSKEPLPRSRGHHDASSDLVLTRRRWAGRLLNVAVRTGLQIGAGFLAVLDVDGEAGYQALADLERQHGPMPATFTVSTSRGEHRYLAGPPLQSRTGFRPGLDLKAAGGYVVGPCSVHPSGVTYQCVDWSAPIAATPDWLVRIVQHRETVKHSPARTKPPADDPDYGHRALRREVEALEPVRSGRNAALVRAAFKIGQLVHMDKIDRKTAFEDLLEAAKKTGLDDREATRTINRGLDGAATVAWSHRHAS